MNTYTAFRIARITFVMALMVFVGCRSSVDEGGNNPTIARDKDLEWFLLTNYDPKGKVYAFRWKGRRLVCNHDIPFIKENDIDLEFQSKETDAHGIIVLIIDDDSITIRRSVLAGGSGTEKRPVSGTFKKKTNKEISLFTTSSSVVLGYGKNTPVIDFSVE